MDLRERRIFRSREHRTLAGICGGLGEYLEVDPVFVRLLWVIGTCVTGIVPGLLAYVVGWLVVPDRPAPVRQPVAPEPDPGS